MSVAGKIGPANRTLSGCLPLCSGAGKGKGATCPDAPFAISYPNERHRPRAMHAPNDRGIPVELTCTALKPPEHNSSNFKHRSERSVQFWALHSRPWTRTSQRYSTKPSTPLRRAKAHCESGRTGSAGARRWRDTTPNRQACWQVSALGQSTVSMAQGGLSRRRI